MPISTEQLEEAIRTKIEGGVEHVVSLSVQISRPPLYTDAGSLSSKYSTFLVSDL